MPNHLFSPIKIGSLSLANRFIMGSMHTGLDHSDDPFGRLAAFYKERADGGVGLIVTGGVSPNEQGLLSPGSMKLTDPEQVADYKIITDAVHESGSHIILQILHAGRYAKQKNLVAPSPIRSPINKFEPKEMSEKDILSTIDDYVNCASLAQQAGFDGIELLGSEGYFLNEFTASRTNQRTDQWGGSFENRARFPLTVLQSIREKVGSQFFIQYRMSMLDLVEDGWTIHEAQQFAQLLEANGVDLINTGIGWHESSIPTIAMQVPRAAFSWATRMIKQVVNIPVAAANRINTTEVANTLIQQGDADLVYLSRPFLADPDFVIKAQQQRSDEINSCIACNQSCLDNLFNFKTVSCLVNPRACHETKMPKLPPAPNPQNIAVIGAGAAGLSFAIEAKKLGHNITLFDASADIGGQMAYARKVPGKEEFDELLRYFNVMLKKYHVNTQLNTTVTLAQLNDAKYDSIVIAAGIKPRKPNIPGIHRPNVFSYEEAFNSPEKIGQTVLIIGAGGIGYDMAEFLTHQDDGLEPIDSFNKHWGIDPTGLQSGGLNASVKPIIKSKRTVTILQRKAGKFGRTLGKTTGWIHQAELQKRGVKFLGELNYIKIDETGLHIEKEGTTQLLHADSIVICAGQESRDELAQQLGDLAPNVYKIGGAKEVRELDAAQAISDGIKLAYTLST